MRFSAFNNRFVSVQSAAVTLLCHSLLQKSNHISHFSLVVALNRFSGFFFSDGDIIFACLLFMLFLQDLSTSQKKKNFYTCLTNYTSCHACRYHHHHPYRHENKSPLAIFCGFCINLNLCAQKCQHIEFQSTRNIIILCVVVASSLSAAAYIKI